MFVRLLDRLLDWWRSLFEGDAGDDYLGEISRDEVDEPKPWWLP